MGKLDRKVALVTGGNSGIGFATAKRFVADGAYVFITGRRNEELEAAAAEIGRNVMAVQGDVSKPADLDRLFATVKEVKGGIDILFANAGVAEGSPLGEISEYSATKAALRSFARTWTMDLKDRKIRVNVVSPGAIDTPGLQGLNKKDSEGLDELFRGRIPLGRVGLPDDVASAVSFLASDESSYISGIELFVDGGLAQV